MKNPFPRNWRELDAYFRGNVPLKWDLELIGTDFQRRVWGHSLKSLWNNSHIQRYWRKCRCRGYRAVGNAIGANPIAIIVPCHRVVGASGLGGFSGGLNVKRFLLELEGALSPPMHHA